jgi:hypothetical protein
MPLLDHFRPPLSQRRPWESFHTTWASALADHLNQGLLPPGYIALEQIHAGAPAEIDVATWSESDTGGGTATATRTVWVPAAAPVVLPALFPESCTVEIQASEGGRTLVAALELVSPANKDRDSKRRLFAAKCATYLARGVALVVIDVVTTRQNNLHNELIDLMGLDPAFRLPATSSLYAVAYRPLRREQTNQIDTWPTVLQVGEALPAVPLSLGADLCLRLDLEASYQDACQRRKLAEVLD